MDMEMGTINKTFFFLFVFGFFETGFPGIHFVDQAGLELRNPPASVSRVLGLKVCATTPGFSLTFYIETGSH